MVTRNVATNAAKYGSLSNATGAVDIVWKTVTASGPKTAAVQDGFQSKTTEAHSRHRRGSGLQRR
jgi:two-component sensor histidine kinase